MPSHDGSPPSNWPSGVIYLSRSRLSTKLPKELVPLITTSPNFTPRPIAHPSHLAIKTISQPGQPAHGQAGLFAKKKINGAELLIPYLGVIHATLASAETNESIPDEHSDSDYDLSLLRLSASDIKNPFPGYHVSIGVDAAKMGNAARFVNDYRGIGTAPNAEFRVGRGEGGELRMEIWSLKSGVGKGDEILVSYGKGWWGARKE